MSILERQNLQALREEVTSTRLAYDEVVSRGGAPEWQLNELWDANQKACLDLYNAENPA